MKEQFKIESFLLLAQRLNEISSTERYRGIVAEAVAANSWFTPEDIDYALKAIMDKMLDEQALRAWLGGYTPPSEAKDVVIIMAGNIPLAGFYDLLSVVVCGHRCHIKYSSKDRALMSFIVELLKDIDPTLPIYEDEPKVCDMLIFSGSDAVAEIYSSRYAAAKMVLRTSRYSIAVLDGSESESQINLLKDDLFRYFGMGCRNVSMLFIPEDFDLNQLKNIDIEPLIEHKGFSNNYRSVKALRTMESVPFIDLGGFILLAGDAPSNYISELRYMRYNHISEVERWISEHQEKLQCVVSHINLFDRTVEFGRAQQPELRDFADGIDIVDMLCEI